MTGKILGQGAIRGEDGVRYYYDDGAIKNLQETQKINGCEVDFEIENGKAVDIFIIKSGESKVESNDIAKQSTDNLTNNSNEVISKAFAGGFIFKGRVSNCGNDSLGSIGGLQSKVIGNHLSGSFASLNLKFTNFDMGNKSFGIFEMLGSKPISNGDEVVLYAKSTFNGRYQAENLKNITRGLFFKKSSVGCIIAMMIFGFASLYCLTSISNHSLIASIAFITCFIFGDIVFCIMQSKLLKFVFFIAYLAYIIPLFAICGITSRIYLSPYSDFVTAIVKGEDAYFALFWIFVCGVVASCIAINNFRSIKTIKAINDAVKNYE